MDYVAASQGFFNIESLKYIQFHESGDHVALQICFKLPSSYFKGKTNKELNCHKLKLEEVQEKLLRLDIASLTRDPVQAIAALESIYFQVQSTTNVLKLKTASL